MTKLNLKKTLIVTQYHMNPILSNLTGKYKNWAFHGKINL